MREHGCEPECLRGCTNGVCTSPNKCTCHPGYEIDETGTKCNPICSQGCNNGDCTAPDVCTCRQGYQLNGNRCEPVCRR